MIWSQIRLMQMVPKPLLKFKLNKRLCLILIPLFKPVISQIWLQMKKTLNKFSHNFYLTLVKILSLKESIRRGKFQENLKMREKSSKFKSKKRISTISQREKRTRRTHLTEKMWMTSSTKSKMKT
jgi:hypothetical protein